MAMAINLNKRFLDMTKNKRDINVKLLVAPIKSVHTCKSTAKDLCATTAAGEKKTGSCTCTHKLIQNLQFQGSGNGNGCCYLKPKKNPNGKWKNPADTRNYKSTWVNFHSNRLPVLRKELFSREIFYFYGCFKFQENHHFFPILWKYLFIFNKTFTEILLYRILLSWNFVWRKTLANDNKIFQKLFCNKHSEKLYFTSH